MHYLTRFLNMRFALKGLWLAVREEVSFQIFLAGSITLIGIAVFQGAAPWKIALFLFITACLLGAELLNSALERLADKVEPRRDPAIAAVKDLAAAGVLLVGSSGFAAYWIILSAIP